LSGEQTKPHLPPCRALRTSRALGRVCLDGFAEPTRSLTAGGTPLGALSRRRLLAHRRAVFPWPPTFVRQIVLRSFPCGVACALRPLGPANTDRRGSRLPGGPRPRPLAALGLHLYMCMCSLAPWLLPCSPPAGLPTVAATSPKASRAQSIPVSGRARELDRPVLTGWMLPWSAFLPVWLSRPHNLLAWLPGRLPDGMQTCPHDCQAACKDRRPAEPQTMSTKLRG
jgi:hypothetical protein